MVQEKDRDRSFYSGPRACFRRRSRIVIDGKNLCRLAKDAIGSTCVSRERHADRGRTEACPCVFPRPKPTKTVVITSQSLRRLSIILLSLASSVPTRPTRQSFDSANGRTKYTIARTLFAMFTLVALASYKAAKSTDWIYVKGYPVSVRSKQQRTERFRYKAP